PCRGRACRLRAVAGQEDASPAQAEAGGKRGCPAASCLLQRPPEQKPLGRLPPYHRVESTSGPARRREEGEQHGAEADGGGAAHWTLAIMPVRSVVPSARQ